MSPKRSFPSNDETTTIRQFLVEPDAKLRDLKDRISALQAVSQKLMQERSEVKNQTDAHEALLSPIRRIPDDILEEIFYCCLPKGRNPAMSEREAPILLGRVCGRWRHISLTSRRLWAALHITVNFFRYGKPFLPAHLHAGKVHAIKDWLARSGDQPLSISLFLQLDMILDMGSPIDQLYLDVLLSVVERCKVLSFTVVPSDWIQSFSRLQTSDVPLLERLHLAGVWHHRRPGHSHTSTVKESGFMNGPRLQSISLPRFNMPFHELPVRWAGLVELNLLDSPSSSMEISRVLSSCPELQYCRLILPRRNDTTDLPHILLPKLIGLAIVHRRGSARADATSCLLHSMSAPRIRHLECKGVSLSGERFCNALLEFTRRMIQPLEELDFNLSTLPKEDVITMLSLLPGLKRLRIRDRGGRSWHVPLNDDRLLQEFIPRDYHSKFQSSIEMENGDSAVEDRLGRGCLCPRLDILHCDRASFSGSVLFSFLHSRSSLSALSISHVSPLKKLVVTFKPQWELSKRMRRKIDKLADKARIIVKLDSGSGILASPKPSPRRSVAYSGIPQWKLGSTASEGYFGF